MTNNIVVIGGGPAGMAAAYSAKVSGAEHVILIERYGYLGGVLPQCIHNGFGTQLYNEDYTGGEYANIWKNKVEQADIEIRLNTTVLSIEKGWKVNCVSAANGTETITAKAVIIATGCRERTLPQLGISGSRPAGIFTAGAAQAMMNLKNYLPGKTAVILGSGDIGLIMARRMTLEGIDVKLVLGEKSTGLPRNIVQCIEDFDIPLKYGWTIVSTHGYQRLKGVNIAPFDDNGTPDMSKKEYIPCDTLLVAAGLIPEIEICNGYIPGSDEGLFFCGNANFVHDLVDNVTSEAVNIAINAVQYVTGKAQINDELEKLKSKNESEKYIEKQGNMICTVCPKGCMMQVELEPFCVTGNECDRGIEFAKQEIKSPKRIVTTIIKAEGGSMPVLSVKTSDLVDKKDIPKIIKVTKKVKCTAPISVGDVVCEDVSGLGVNLVATMNLYP